MSPSHVVVDGSNIATEGRSTPSLQQLDDAIRQFQAEFPDTEVIVVVDATFGHRIEPGERAIFDEAVAHGELVSPPAGAIGRGDAFVLRVAERVGAQVLSNDSFQEFHAEHPWLFEEGRLMGGKPVPGVGWIFTPRLPVRGPRSRAATSTGSARGGRHRKDDEPEPKPERSRGTSKVAAEAIALATAEGKGSRALKATKEPAKAAKPSKTAKAAKPSNTTKPAKTTKAAEAAKPAKTTKAAKPAKSAKATKTTKAAKTAKTAKTASAAKTTGSVKGARAAKEPPVAGTGDAVAKRSSRRGRRGRGTAEPAVRAAIEAATEEALGAPAADPLAAPPGGAGVVGRPAPRSPRQPSTTR